MDAQEISRVGGGDTGPNARTRWLMARGARTSSGDGVARVAIPTTLIVRGALVPAAQLVCADAAPWRPRTSRSDAEGSTTSTRPGRPHDGAHRLIDELAASGARAVFAVPSDAWPTSVLEGLGLAPAFEVSLRNFYLSLGALSGVLEERGPHPLRKAAAFARRIRQKMVEVDFDVGWLGDAARVHGERRQGLGLAVARDLDYLAWRYRDAPARNLRMLVLRGQVGAGIDGYAVVEPLPSDTGVAGMRVVDHWSRSADRVGDSRFMFELALWFLSERATVVQALGVQGSALDGLFLRTGGFKKAWSSHLWWRSLDDRLPTPSAADAALRSSDLLDY